MSEQGKYEERKEEGEVEQVFIPPAEGLGLHKHGSYGHVGT
jgi:hypothetical protein